MTNQDEKFIFECLEQLHKAIEITHSQVFLHNQDHNDKYVDSLECLVKAKLAIAFLRTKRYFKP